MQRKITVLLIICFSFVFQLSEAKIKLPSVFSDNMVIQRDKPITIWGRADRNESVEVRFLNQVKKTKADKQGNWSVSLAPVTHGGPYTLEVNGKTDRIALNDVLVGEVWLCSGQSNMEWTVRKVNHAEEEISNAGYPQIRAFNVIHELSATPKDELDGKWQACSPATVADFSAVAYFFAHKLYQELQIPVGIIHSSWGGSDIETWISPGTFGKLDERFKKRYPVLNPVTDFKYTESVRNQKAYFQALSNDPGLAEHWYSPSYSTASWKTMPVPQHLEKTLGDVDGIIYFKQVIDLPEDMAGVPAKLHLGPVDDDDVTWLNGEKIGETRGYDVYRNYNIPQGVLQAGKNTLVVKVFDSMSPGGIWGQPDEMYLEAGGRKYPLAGDWQYREAVTNKQYNVTNISQNDYPSLLYNAMIHPLVRFAIGGVIWYQGENNVWAACNYRTLFPVLINDWRAKWKDEFPFYWVQLANYTVKEETPGESNWAELREAQTMTLSLPKTGQAVITDIGEAYDIHPRNKQDVGLRLALTALNKNYEKKDIVCSGPVFKSMKIDGDKAVIEFDHAESGLFVKNKYGYIEGFAIAGADGKFVWAKAYPDGNKVVVYSPEVKHPADVRYSWSNNPDVNLFNKEGLPAAPFRTDSRKGITQCD